jgi:hypothetical protein
VPFRKILLRPEEEKPSVSCFLARYDTFFTEVLVRYVTLTGTLAFALLQPLDFSDE